MLHTLKTLYEYISKHYPELVDEELQQYCTLSITFDKGSSRMNFGYNSLKWLVYSLRNIINHRDLQMLFYHILTEHKAFNKTSYQLQHKIINYPSVKPYKIFLSQDSDKSLNSIQSIKLVNDLFIINNFINNFSLNQFEDSNLKGIIYLDEKLNSAGYIIRFSNETVALLKDIQETISSYDGVLKESWKLEINNTQPCILMCKSNNTFSIQELLLFICQHYFKNNLIDCNYMNDTGMFNNIPSLSQWEAINKMFEYKSSYVIFK